MKKIIALVLSVMLIACVFTACGSGESSENTINVTVNFEADGKQFYSKSVDVIGDDPTVITAVQYLALENDDITIVLDDEENPTCVLDVDDYTDGEKFWDFKIGDKDYGVSGASVAKIKDGDVITFGYMTSDEFAALEVEE